MPPSAGIGAGTADLSPATAARRAARGRRHPVADSMRAATASAERTALSSSGTPASA